MPIDANVHIARESAAFSAVLGAVPLDQRVPGCPEWTLRDLTWHLGRVQRFWADTIGVGADVQPSFADVEPEPGPAAMPAIGEWFRASTRALLDAIAATPPSTPAWVWWRVDRTVGAIARHQAQEAAVHRWDAESAGGTARPLDPELADDGLDEFLGIARQLRDPAPVAFVATDSGRRIRLSDDPPAVTVSGSASDLVLLLHRRIAPSAVTVDGDRAALDAFLVPIA